MAMKFFGLLVLAAVFIGPALCFERIIHHSPAATAAPASKFPFTTLHPLHRAWMPLDAARAATFFLLISVVGLIAPLRGGMSARWIVILMAGCWVLSFLFVPGVERIGNADALLEKSFYTNLGLSLLWTLLFTGAWLRVQTKLPRIVASTLVIPLFMTIHTLTSFLYVFSFYQR